MVMLSLSLGHLIYGLITTLSLTVLMDLLMLSWVPLLLPFPITTLPTTMRSHFHTLPPFKRRPYHIVYVVPKKADSAGDAARAQ